MGSDECRNYRVCPDRFLFIQKLKHPQIKRIWQVPTCLYALFPNTYLCVNSNISLAQLVSPSVALPAKLVLCYSNLTLRNLRYLQFKGVVSSFDIRGVLQDQAKIQIKF